MEPKPDYGEATYRGSNKLKDEKAVITGADSGIGRAVALAFAREGADVLVAYLDEHDDANETKRLIEEAGRKCLLVPGDVSPADHCRKIVKRAVDEFGRIDVLVNNAAHQMSFNEIEEISDEEWEKTLSTNISAMFYIVKSAIKYMPKARPLSTRHR
jgi:NAD(P)-dependent dehydrogenase (short-subunit alcohol dehydrogenase family)